MSIRHNIFLSSSALAAALLVSACGGGGSSAPNLTAQTITWSSAPTTGTAGSAAVALSATSPGGTVVFTVPTASASVCSVSGANLTYLAAGTCTVNANQAGSSTYAAATEVQKSITVTLPVITSTSPIDFETIGRGANFAWETFENSTNPGALIVANPSATGANTSSKVIKFTSLQAGQPWAGFQSKHTTVIDLGTVTFSASNALVKMMVYKPIRSDVGIKFASNTNASTGEIKVANTKINEWEELTFNFCSRTGEVNDQIIFFPDFSARTSDTVSYLDNITFNACPPSAPSNAPTAPPTFAAANVKSLYSEAFDTVTGTDTPNWNQGTVVTSETYASNQVLKLSNFNYQGIITADPLDVSTFTKLHIDFWSEAATTIEVKLVSLVGGTKETSLFIPVNAGVWTQKEITLSDFTATDKTKFQQLILAAQTNGGKLFIDNVYFWK